MKVLNTNLHFRANRMSTMQANYVDSELKRAKNVDIICHDMTDRDGANSALAMWDYLNNQGINARVIMAQKTPNELGLRTYDFNFIQATDKEKLDEVQPDIVFCVDFGGKDRVSKDVLEHIEKSPKVMGFDHHSEVDIARGDYMQLKKPLEDDECVYSRVSFYSDKTAKSATSVIYRFFEALDREIDNEAAYDLLSGFVDDSVKRSLVKCNGEKGEILPSKELMEDKHAYEIFENLKSKLTDEQIATIAKNVDVLSSLTSEQKEFKESLANRTKLSKNGKIAYVQIQPDDKQWEELGGDNTITSGIINRHRQAILSDEKYKDVDVAFVFYEANGRYRLSAHAKNPNLIEFFNYVDKNAIEGFSKNAGGHPTRGGATICQNTDDEKCNEIVDKILSCDDFFEMN